MGSYPPRKFRFVLILRLIMAYKRTMYAEHKPQHFKIYCTVPEANMLVKVYPSEFKYPMYGVDNCPLVFHKLVEKYSKKMGQKPACMQAAQVLTDFFDACDELTKEKKLPFKLHISFLDPNLYKPHGKQTTNDSCKSD